jgi:DNA mismatch endonuclease Vsr
MPDTFTKQKRSEMMSRIRSAGNKGTELRLVQIFRTNSITGWRRGSKLPGKPDFVFPKQRLAVFVDGCFWHGCPKHATWLHGANARPKAGAVPVARCWCEMHCCRRANTRPASSPSADGTEPGAEASLEKFRS